MTLAAAKTAQRNRAKIFVEDGKLLEKHVFASDQFVLRFHAPRCARRALAGSFIHIQCSAGIPMRRPLSIMRANADEGWIEVLFKIVGAGLRALADATVGDERSIIGPIGRGFAPHPDRPNALLIGGGVGIPPMIFLAEQLLADAANWRPGVFMGSEIPFPFDVARSTLSSPWLPAEVVSAMPLLEDWGVCSRLASLSGFEGCLNGYVTDLARAYLNALDEERRARAQILACGPTAMLRAVASLAEEFNLPCQVALEEFMACAIGGCAGCTVEIQTPDGPAMKRVCVDGPVFEASSVFPGLR